MENISQLYSLISGSYNETHRICTHEMSGHIHLIRFCVDELLEQYGYDNNFLNKLHLGVNELEELNKLWKMCTKSFHGLDRVDFVSIVDKAVGLNLLYNKKLLKNDLIYHHHGQGHTTGDNAVIYTEFVFAASSIFVEMAYRQGKEELRIDFFCLNEQCSEIELTCELDQIDQGEFSSFLVEGCENDKTLRKSIANIMNDFNGEVKYLFEDNKAKIRLKL